MAMVVLSAEILTEAADALSERIGRATSTLLVHGQGKKPVRDILAIVHMMQARTEIVRQRDATYTPAEIPALRSVHHALLRGR